MDAGGWEELVHHQPQQPKMVLIQPEINGGSIKLKAPGMEELCLPLVADGGKEGTVEIFGDHCVALESGADSSEWFSTFLGI